MRDIVIIANFCRDFSIYDNGRFMFLCKALARNNNVEIITSDFRHATKKRKEGFNNTWPFKITFLHEVGYKKNVSLRRFYSHYYWGKQVGKYLKKRKIPDVIYCAIPSLTASLKAAKYCKRNKVKFIIDIQDIWPEAFQMAFNVPVISNVVFYPFKAIANKIYKSADEIVAVSNTYVKRALSVNKKCENGLVVFLGTDLNTFDAFCSENKTYKKKEKWLGYCGSLSVSYDLIVVFDALKCLKDKNQDVPLFVIMGDGPKRKEFEEYSKNSGVKVLFTGRLPYNEMCGMLCQCDLVINPISNGAAQSIINKHGDYASAGVPVLNTQESQEYRDLIEYYKMGLNCNNNDPIDLSNKINYYMQNPEACKNAGLGARKCAEEHFDRSFTYEKILNIMESVYD